MPLHQYRGRLFDELMPSFLEAWPGGAVGFEQRCAQGAVIAQHDVPQLGRQRVPPGLQRPPFLPPSSFTFASKTCNERCGPCCAIACMTRKNASLLSKRPYVPVVTPAAAQMSWMATLSRLRWPGTLRPARRCGGATCTAVARRGRAGCPSSADNGRPSRVPDATALASQYHGVLGQPLDPALRDPELLPGRTRAAASGSAERAMMKLVV